jgi:hypothetical protein
MNEPLRPSTLGEILDRTAQLYRRNFWLFAGTAALPFVVMVGLIAVAVPLGILAVPGIGAGGGNAGSVGLFASAVGGIVFIVAFLIVLPVYLAFYVYAVAGITQTTVRVHRGEKLTIRAALKSVSPRFWTYLRFLFLEGFMAGIVPLFLAGALIGPLIYLITRPGVGIEVSLALGFVVFVLGAAAIGVIIWLALSFAMGMAVCVVEKRTAWQSLRRSMSLSKGTLGRIFVLFLLIMVLSGIVSTVSYIFAIMVAAVASVAGLGSTGAAIAAAIGGVLYGVVSIGAQIVLQPVSWIALVLFYYDQRIRKEGLDIEWMMEQAGMTQPLPAAAPGSNGVISAHVAPPDTVEER